MNTQSKVGYLVIGALVVVAAVVTPWKPADLPMRAVTAVTAATPAPKVDRVVSEEDRRRSLKDTMYSLCASRAQALEMKKYMYDETCRIQAELAAR